MIQSTLEDLYNSSEMELYVRIIGEARESKDWEAAVDLFDKK